ncbi:hypothetical protein M3Y94_00513100 [Aphelenchoides besseyi]|nr:hypothetical protein M3Y94_00513100 [Aphelenchoides besseyi]KAI6226037.1 hypothetical protein M3Y95_00759800 [Aphelenchoides besseyi]
MFSIIVILLLISNTETATVSRKCPTSCECTSQSDGTESVQCSRGDLNDANFYRILEEMPTNTATLEIVAPFHRPNQFRWNDNLNNFKHLTHLSLVNCGIPALSQSMRLPSLKHLNLRQNRIDSLQINSFQGLSSLESLDLSHNRLTVLPSGAFIYLKTLRSLSVAHNNFTDLPTSLLRGPKQLQELQLDGNPVQTAQLNELFNDVPELQRLELNFCSMDNGKVSELRLSRVPQVRRLGLGGNNLTEVPSSTFRALAHLHTIDLSHNGLRRLQPCAFCACNISKVILRHNLLGLSPRALHSEAFAEAWIRDLDLSYNFYDEFNAKLLGYAQGTVQTLHLSGNSLGSIQSHFTSLLPSLTALHLADNQINELPFSWPTEYGQLRFLNLSKNNLRELPTGLENSLYSLRQLDLSQNALSSISEVVLKHFVEQLDSIYLDGNPWDCRCAVQNLQQFILRKYENHTDLRYDQTLCAQPDLLKGQPLHRVQHINDCAVFFGSTYGLTQASELILLLCVILAAAGLIAVVVIMFLYCGRNQRIKKTATTKRVDSSSSRFRLTRSNDTNAFATTPVANEMIGSSMNSSMLSEPLTHSASASISSAHDLPPPLVPNSAFLPFSY